MSAVDSPRNSRTGLATGIGTPNQDDGTSARSDTDARASHRYIAQSLCLPSGQGCREGCNSCRGAEERADHKNMPFSVIVGQIPSIRELSGIRGIRIGLYALG